MGITHCGYCGVASCCVCIINKAIMGPSNATILLSVPMLLPRRVSKHVMAITSEQEEELLR
jgi:hypothetical protein